jgi:hypothetical protein
MPQAKLFMSSDRNAKLVGLSLLALLLFTFPLLEIFGKESYVLGLPLLYIYIFVVWLVIILILRQIFTKRK